MKGRSGPPSLELRVAHDMTWTFRIGTDTRKPFRQMAASEHDPPPAETQPRFTGALRGHSDSKSFFKCMRNEQTGRRLSIQGGEFARLVHMPGAKWILYITVFWHIPPVSNADPILSNPSLFIGGLEPLQEWSACHISPRKKHPSDI